MSVIDRKTLEMALIGYEAEQARIERAIADIRTHLNNSSPADQHPNKRRLSAAARGRIAAAQRKRWAVQREGKAANQPPRQKRKLSTAGRKAIIDATKRRWAAFRKAQATAKRKARMSSTKARGAVTSTNA